MGLPGCLLDSRSCRNGPASAHARVSTTVCRRRKAQDQVSRSVNTSRLASGLLVLALAPVPVAHKGAPPIPKPAIDLSKFNYVRIEYDSEGGMGEAYYFYDGRMWQRWETDTPAAEENLMHRLSQLTRINVNRTPTNKR